MTYLVLLLLILILTMAPQWWVQKVFLYNSAERADFPGTGGQLAAHLIHQLNIPEALVVSENLPSHFDPEKTRIVLTPEYFDGKSLTAIAVAAHEVGHLIQKEQRNPWLTIRTHLGRWSLKADRIGVIALFFFPVISVITRSPAIAAIFLGVGFFSMIMNVITHVMTLPLEYDASFNKALPLLIDGNFVSRSDIPELKRILRAAAMTYLASALAGLLNLSRWIRIFKR